MPNARKSGIYVIENTVTGGFYIGSATDLVRRACQHRYDLRHGTHGNPRLQRAWNKYGEQAFRWIDVAVIDPDAAKAAEQRLLDRLIDMPACYNVNRQVTLGRLGMRHTPETKERIARAMRGQKQSAETIRRRSDALRGRKASPESIAKRVAAYKAGGHRPPLGRGRPLTDAEKDNLRSKLLGKPQSDETKQRRSASLKEAWRRRKEAANA